MHNVSSIGEQTLLVTLTLPMCSCVIAFASDIKNVCLYSSLFSIFSCHGLRHPVTYDLTVNSEAAIAGDILRGVWTGWTYYTRQNSRVKKHIHRIRIFWTFFSAFIYLKDHTAYRIRLLLFFLASFFSKDFAPANRD